MATFSVIIIIILLLFFSLIQMNRGSYFDANIVQPRYLLTSLALNDFAIGILITPLGILPALFHCWPYGEIFCQIQVILSRYFHLLHISNHQFFFIYLFQIYIFDGQI